MYNKIINFYNEHINDIEFIFVGGSSKLSYIENPHDIDIFVVLKDYSNVKEKMKSIIKLHKELREIDNKIVINAQYKFILQKWLGESVEIPEKFESRSVLPVYAYICPEIDIICGEDTVGIKNLNLLNEPFKSNFIQSLKNYLPIEQRVLAETGKHSKSLYHLLTGLYILKNNSYELTQEQIDNINLLHSSHFPQELVDWIYEEVDKL